jgi:hypothetical protein
MPPTIGGGNATRVNFARNAFTGFLFGTGSLSPTMAISGSNELSYTGTSTALEANSTSLPLNIDFVNPEIFTGGQ